MNPYTIILAQNRTSYVKRVFAESAKHAYDHFEKEAQGYVQFIFEGHSKLDGEEGDEEWLVPTEIK